MNNQRAIYSRLLPFAAYIVFLAIADSFPSLFSWLGLDIKFGYVLRIAAAVALLVYFWQDYIELKTIPALSDFFYAAIAGAIVFIIWIFPYPALFGGNDTVGFNPFAGESEQAALLWMLVRVLGAAIVVPIMEELFWRSYLMRWFDNENFMSVSPERISNYAYLGSACVFAIEHNLWLAGLFAGLVYGELYKTYKNLWVPIFAHAVTNGLLAAWVIYGGHWNYW